MEPEVLRVIPIGSNRIAVEVAHGKAACCKDADMLSGNAGTIGASHGFGKEIHFSAVEGLLLRSIVMALIRSSSLIPVQTKWVRASQFIPGI
jgi:hypothetical protein